MYKLILSAIKAMHDEAPEHLPGSLWATSGNGFSVRIQETDQNIFVSFHGDTSVGSEELAGCMLAETRQVTSLGINPFIFEAWKSIQEEFTTEIMTRRMIEAINKNATPDSPPKECREIIYCGYGVAGALATLAAAAHKPAHLITLEQPPVGGKKFNKVIRESGTKYTRIVLGKSLLAQLFMFSPSYRHSGDIVFIDKTTNAQQMKTKLGLLLRQGFGDRIFEARLVMAVAKLAFITGVIK